LCRRGDGAASLITAAHHQLQEPADCHLDNLNTDVSTVICEFTGSHPDWLTVIQLAAYAPELNAAEGLWASTQNGLDNLAACSADQLAAVIRTRLKRIQYQPASTGSSPRPDSASNPNRCKARPWPYNLCSTGLCQSRL
jgi:hypothetical protein